MSDKNPPSTAANDPRGASPSDVSASERNSSHADPELSPRLQQLVARAQKTMAHAWMVRTFVKHSDEVEDYPEINEVARTIFDTFRALETQVDDPASYFKVVRKKLGKLKAAAEQFEKDAWHASTHTNFQQAVVSAQYVGEQLEEILNQAESLLPKPVAPPKITLPGSKPVRDPESGE